MEGGLRFYVFPGGWAEDLVIDPEIVVESTDSCLSRPTNVVANRAGREPRYMRRCGIYDIRRQTDITIFKNARFRRQHVRRKRV